jgi:WD40 repeat protein
MRQPDTPTAFISYSSQDAHFVERLAKGLLASGIKVWFDKWEIRVGDSLIDMIQKGLSENDFLIVVLSQSSVESPWVRRELNVALMGELEKQHVIVLPVVIDDCEIPVFLKEKRYADFRKPFESGLDELVLSLFARTNETRAFNPAKTLNNEWGVVRALSASATQPYFLSLSEDATVRTWAIPTGKMVRCFFTRQFPFDAKITTDGRHVVVSTRNNWWERMLVIFDIFSGDRVTSIWDTDHEPARQLVCLPSGICAGISTRLVKYTYGERSAAELCNLSHDIDLLSMGRDGNFFAAASTEGVVSFGRVSGPSTVASRSYTGARVYALAIHPTTMCVAYGLSTTDGVLVHSDSALEQILPHSNQVSALAFSENGHLLAAGDWDGGLYLYRYPSFDRITAIRAHGEMIQSIAFSLGDEYLVTGTGDRGIPSMKIWNLRTGILESTILGKRTGLESDQVHWSDWKL